MVMIKVGKYQIDLRRFGMALVIGLLLLLVYTWFAMVLIQWGMKDPDNGWVVRPTFGRPFLSFRAFLLLALPTVTLYWVCLKYACRVRFGLSMTVLGLFLLILAIIPPLCYPYF